MRAFDLYAKSLDEAGILRSAEVLQPSSATTTVTRADGELVVQDARSSTSSSDSAVCS